VHSKHVTLGNEFVKVGFSVNNFKIAFGVGLLIAACQILLDFAATIARLQRVCKSHTQLRWCFPLQCNLELIQATLRFLFLPFHVYLEKLHYISE